MAGSSSKSLVKAAEKYAGAKSHRDLERLLGKRTVGGRRRKGQLLQASNKWQPWELELLAKVPDRELAKRTGRTPIAVEAKREKLRLRRRASPSAAWSPDELALVGKLPDKEV